MRHRGLGPQKRLNLRADDAEIDAIVGNEGQYPIISRTWNGLLLMAVLVDKVVFRVGWRIAPFLSFPRRLGCHDLSRPRGQ